MSKQKYFTPQEVKAAKQAAWKRAHARQKALQDAAGVGKVRPQSHAARNGGELPKAALQKALYLKTHTSLTEEEFRATLDSQHTRDAHHNKLVSYSEAYELIHRQYVIQYSALHTAFALLKQEKNGKKSILCLNTDRASVVAEYQKRVRKDLTPHLA